MISTTFVVVNMTSSDDVRVIRDEVSAVPGLGAVAAEVIPGNPSTLILKHRDDVVPDRAAIEAAVRKAGDFTLG